MMEWQGRPRLYTIISCPLWCTITQEGGEGKCIALIGLEALLSQSIDDAPHLSIF